MNTLLFVALSLAAASERAPVLVDGRLPAGVAPTRYTIEWTLDLTQDRFRGDETIALKVSTAQKRIVLHAEGVAISSAVVEQKGQKKKGRVSLNAAENVAVIDAPLAVGDATLHLTFDAPYDGNLRGIYKVKDDGRAYAFTQMEAISARRAFPCFDEPSFKTPFDISVVVAKDDVAVGNAPVVEETALKGDKKRVRFAATQPLPTYLIALAVGPLDVVEAPPVPQNDVRKTPLPLRGVAARGKGARMQYVLRETPAIVAALEKWFGMPYPFDKLDLIAVPDFAAGAMENPGAITFKEHFLLVDEATAPLWQKKSFVGITSHELAHMWFGDLVTLAWWDDTWLNEAFATWMASKAVDAVHPEYRADLGTVERSINAFGADSFLTARRIRNPIKTVGDIENSFDGITYQKGAAVLSMFERWLGPASFQRGVRDYLARHAGGNATAADLMAALSQASGKDVATPFSTFIDQSGLPVVDVRRACEGERAVLQIAQSRWLPIGSKADATSRWQLPLCVKGLTRGGSVEQCALVVDATKSLPLPTGTCSAVVLPNAGADGYLRFNMPLADLARLVDARRDLLPRERIIVADAVRAGALSGALPFDQAWSVAKVMIGDKERASVTTALDLLRLARDELAPDLAPRIDGVASTSFSPVVARLGWSPAPGEDPEDTQLRSAVISSLAITFDDPQIRARLAAQGRKILDGTARPEGDLVDAALVSALREDGAPAFERMVAQLADERDGLQRGRLVQALGATTDPALLDRARALILSPALRTSEVGGLFGRLINDPRSRDATLAWAETHVDELRARLPGGRKGGGLPRSFGGFCDDAAATRIRALFVPRLGEMVGAQRNLDATLEQIQLCAARRAAQGENVRRLFADQTNGG